MYFKKTLLVIFIAYLLVTDEAEAFWGFIAKAFAKAIPGIVGAFSRKSRREIRDLFDSNQRDLDIDRFFSRFPMN
uniref:Antimicrobial peptide n=1 Tax=Hadrurus spadix TaxID=141984 RepID=A0A1W7RAY4_9SCOR